MFDATGVSRRPERFGERAEDPDRDALRRALEAFEARVDTDDPEQVAALESLRRETRELERLRGVWCDQPTLPRRPPRVSVLTHPSPAPPRRHRRGLPGVQRDWNEYPEPERAVPPLEDPRYRAYKEAKAADAVAAAGRPHSLPPPPTSDGASSNC